MMLLRFCLFLSLSIIICGDVVAQEDEFFDGFVALSNGDTLFGNMSLSFIPSETNTPKGIQLIRYDSGGDSITEVLGFTDVIAFENDRGHFMRKKIPFYPSGSFIRVISLGKINLYLHEGVMGIHAFGGIYSPETHAYKHYYIEKGDKFFKVKSGNFDKKIKPLFLDDTKSVERLKNKRINWKHTTVLVEDYNKRNN